MLSLADRLATRGPLVNQGQIQRQIAMADRLMAEWQRRSTSRVVAPFDGELLMSELGMAPGPLLGEVLRQVRLAFEAGEVNTREQAVDTARKYLEHRRTVHEDG
jgi:poly(A) polymerase